MSDEPKTCPTCNGRGYFRCACWPGDCICGQEDETCYKCDGDGFIEEYYDDFEENPYSPEPKKP